MTTHVEVYVESLALDLGADAHPDEAAVRRALESALWQSDELADHGAGEVIPTVAQVVARQVVRDVSHEIRGAVPPC
ncbi:hypothetical protein [Blastococcus saxobsidens]|uniref:Uncharacterized protein n=1 Tax=Blastococcus saxobsidens (strain DD2) TaxID=1146883 RepID=H6RPH5_BLASD|nr:hypothetical protein [Blastococcus saxobsidens]CCG04034.1 protein of unknown function [Blastococcus saxobsidens DD2]